MKATVITLVIISSLAAWSQNRVFNAKTRKKGVFYSKKQVSIIVLRLKDNVEQAKERLFAYHKGKQLYKEAKMLNDLVAESRIIAHEDILNDAHKSYAEYLKYTLRAPRLIKLKDSLFEKSLTQKTYSAAMAFYTKPNKSRAILYFKRYEKLSGIHSTYLDTLLKNLKRPVTLELDSMDVINQTLLLKLVNEIRAKGCRCGNTVMAPTHPLTWNDQLAKAAYRHSRDMAKFNYFDHTGKDGSKPKDRALRAGYTSNYLGENIYWSSNEVTEEEVIETWLNSPGHCYNIMNPVFTEMAIGTYEYQYWTQLLGSAAPKPNASPIMSSK